MKQKNNTPSIGSKVLGNRTIIGIICVIAALIICFGVTPLVNKSVSETTEIVRVKQTIPQGGLITENVIEVVDVGSYNLPGTVCTSKEDVVGKYAKVDMFAGEYILPNKLTTDVHLATDILGDLDGEQKVISITIGSFAQGVSGKLETGDIILRAYFSLTVQPKIQIFAEMESYKKSVIYEYVTGKKEVK